MMPSRSRSRRRGRRRLIGYPHDEFPFRCFTMVLVPERCDLDAVILFRPLSSPGPADFRARSTGVVAMTNAGHAITTIREQRWSEWLMSGASGHGRKCPVTAFMPSRLR